MVFVTSRARREWECLGNKILTLEPLTCKILTQKSWGYSMRLLEFSE